MLQNGSTSVEMEPLLESTSKTIPAEEEDNESPIASTNEITTELESSTPWWHETMMKSIKYVKSFESPSTKYVGISLLCICLLVIFISLLTNFQRFSPITELERLNIITWNNPPLRKSNANYTVHSLLAHRDFDIVLNYYNEDVKYVARFIRYLRNVSTIQRLNPRVIVYNKNANISVEYLKKELLADIVRSLPNYGREGATYLRHIIENYDSIADHTLFSRAGVEGITNVGLEDWLMERLTRQFNSTVGYMPLVSNNWISVYDCGRHPQYAFLERFPELWALAEETLCPSGGQAVNLRGQFLVSGKRIQSRPFSLYQYLHEILTADNSHWIHRARAIPNQPSTQENPQFGHIMERFWTVLFSCSQPDLPDKCKRSQCSCLD